MSPGDGVEWQTSRPCRRSRQSSIKLAFSPVFYPRSIFRLTLIALLVVALPLTAALVGVVLSVERQTDRGQRAVIDAIEATRASRDLVQRLGLVQRQAGQYVVVGDTELLNKYLSSRSGLDLAMKRLRNLIRTGPGLASLEQLVVGEQAMYDEVLAVLPGEPAPLSKYAQGRLLRLAKRIVADMDERVNLRLQEMEVAASEAGRQLLWPMLLVVPVTMLLAFLSTLMIVRPIRRVKAAIVGLGDGQFDQPIAIRGPGDIVSLGERLDWLRRRLHELEQEKARFLGHVSHELKTPLTAVRESAELLADEVLGPLSKNQREVADIMRENAVKLQGLIEGLLNFNVGSIRRDPQSHRPLAMERLVARVLAVHRPMIQKKHLQLVEHLRPARIEGDEEALGIVVDNLISNAIKYSPPGGRIEVDLRSDGRRLMLDVRDQGAGIDANDRKRVFEAFFQGRPPEGESVPGTGLGLSIAAEHVKAHAGELMIVEPQTGQQGAHFRALFPVRPAGSGGRQYWRKRAERRANTGAAPTAGERRMAMQPQATQDRDEFR